MLKKEGFDGRVCRKKPYINEINRRRRLQFAREHVDIEKSRWNNVIFADESKFNVFESDGQQYVWRKKPEELRKKNLLPTVIHGGGNVMVWGCMAAGGVGELVFIDIKMDQHVYLNIMRNNLVQSAESLGIKDSLSTIRTMILNTQLIMCVYGFYTTVQK